MQGLLCRRLGPDDAGSYQSIRLDGFRREPRAFRYAPQDESDMPASEAAARLARDCVQGAFDGETLIGIGGLSWSSGARTRHRALLYGMYVDAAYRGTGISDAIMRALLDEARMQAEIVTLTVISDNARALRFYERWGFRPYGIDKCAAKLGPGDYLDETMMALDFRHAPSECQVFIESKKA